MLRGRPVWFPSNETVAEPSALLNAVAAHRKAAINCVPSLWEAVLQSAVGPEDPAMACDAPIALLIGGDRAPQDLIERSFAVFPKIEIWNLYGPIRATANVAVGRIARGDRITIGRPIYNVKVYILDGYLNPVPVGVAGEIYAGGDGLARGYFNHPELTAEKFVPNPFSEKAGLRLYSTGDLARYLSDGTIEFLGRIDDQVKIRGFRIELGEIETVLKQHSGVHNAVVAAREESPETNAWSRMSLPRKPQRSALCVVF